MSVDVEHIGKAIKKAREAKGLSQRALAKSSGIPQSHISKIERVGVDLTLSSLQALARSLDLEPVLVPRKLIPAVKSLIRTSRNVTVAPETGELEISGHAIRPAYTLDEDEDDG